MTVTPDSTTEAADEAPDDALNQSAAPKQAAGATLGDPRFFAPLSPSAPDGTTDPNNAGPSNTSQSGQNSSARRLRMSLFYAAQQDPDQYAKQLQIQRQTGIPPIVSAGNEKQIQQAVAAKSIDPYALAKNAPRIAGWLSNPDNAAVAGVHGIPGLVGLEQNAAGMRASTTPVDLTANPYYEGTYGMVGPDGKSAQVPFSQVRGAEDMQYQVIPDDLARYNNDAAAAQPGWTGKLASWGAKTFPHITAAEQAKADQAGETWFTPAIDRLMENNVTGLFRGITVIPAGVAGSVNNALSADGWTPAGTQRLRQKEISAALASGQGRVLALGEMPPKPTAEQVSDYLSDWASKLTLGFLFGKTAGAGYEAASSIADPGYAQAASEGLSEGAGEAVGASPKAGLVAGAVPGTNVFSGNLSQAVDAAADSKLRRNAPEKFHELSQTIFQGDDNLHIPVQSFNDYFTEKSMDPAAVAKDIGADNYADAVTTGGNVEVPPANYIGKLDPEHQRGLLPDVVNPASGLTLGQHQALQQWVADGGLEKLHAELAQTDPETAATPEWQKIQGDLRQQYIDAGQTPEAADTLATRDANVYSNLGRKAGMQRGDVFNAYGKFRGWDAAGSIEPEAFDQADEATEEQNAANAQVRIIPSNAQKAPALAISPDAYAYLRKRAGYLGGGHWDGVYLSPDITGRLLDVLEGPLGGLSESAKASVAGFAKTIRENRTLAGGTIFVRDGLHPIKEALSLAEERVHDFQHSFPVDDGWLNKYPEAVKRAEQKLSRQLYPDDQIPDEISAKILAGDRMGLSVQDAESLRDAYLEAVRTQYPYTGLKGLPDLTGSKERLYGPQFSIRETPSDGNSGPRRESLQGPTGSAGTDTGGDRGGDGPDRGEIPGATRAQQGRGRGEEGVASSDGDEESADPYQIASTDKANARTEEQNAANALTQILPGGPRDAPAIALNPDAYAYLRKRVEFLRQLDWIAYHLPPSYAVHVLELIDQGASGLSASAKASLDALTKAIAQNRTRTGGVILIRDALHPLLEAMTVDEERVHSFQERFPLKTDDWLEEYPEAAEKARAVLAPNYTKEQYGIEIGAKLLSGNRIGLSLKEATDLLGAYKAALKQAWGEHVLDELPTLEGAEKRLNGRQF